VSAHDSTASTEQLYALLSIICFVVPCSYDTRRERLISTALDGVSRVLHYSNVNHDYSLGLNYLPAYASMTYLPIALFCNC
jgi:hypothetical protein